MIGGAGGGGTVERDGWDGERTGLLGLAGLRGVDDGDVLGTTTLGVLDNSARGAAGRSVLARRPIGHGIVELKIAVELGNDVERADGSLVDTLAGIATEAGGLALV